MFLPILYNKLYITYKLGKGQPNGAITSYIMTKFKLKDTLNTYYDLDKDLLHSHYDLGQGQNKGQMSSSCTVLGQGQRQSKL